MFDVVGGIFLLYGFFLAIGLGPSLCLLGRDQLRMDCVISLAPLVGLVLTTLFGSYAVIIGWPVQVWALAWIVVALLVSMLIFLRSLGLKKIAITPALWFYLLGLGLTAFFLITPLYLGGINFTVLRGNGTDTFNYMTQAGYLLHEALPALATQSTQMLIDKHPSYYLAQSLLQERWSTGMLLAFATALTHIPLYRIEYGYTLIFFMQAFGGFYLFARYLLKISLGSAVLLSVVLVVGFWAQVVLDIRAMSQISAMPGLILLAYLLVMTVLKKHNQPFLPVALGATAASIFLLYVEILPMCLCAIFLVFLTQLRRQQFARWFIQTGGLALLSGGLAISPAYALLHHFLKQQCHFAWLAANTWHLAYFPWLYASFGSIAGFWGLSPYLAPPWSMGILSLGFGVILSLLILRTLLQTLRQWYLPERIALVVVVSFMVSSWLGFLMLYGRDQLWAAGKMLTYGYPFVALSLVGGMVFEPKHRGSILRAVAVFAVNSWLILQLGLGFYRINYAQSGEEFYNYIHQHGEYRQHDFTDLPFTNNIQVSHCQSVEIDLPNPWLTEYYGFVLGWDHLIIDTQGVLDRGYRLIGQQTRHSSPDCVLVPKDAEHLKNKRILASNQDVALLANDG